LARLLGGQPGPVRAYNTTGLWLSPIETLGDEAKTLVAQAGFKALKMRLGRATVQEDLLAIRTVRDAVGPDIHLMSDFNQSLSYAEALHRLQALDDQGMYWFEEPVVYDHPQRIADITRQIHTPVQIGENIYGPRGFYQSVAAGTADLYMPDLMRIGGVTGWMRAAAIAGAAGLPLSSHLYASVSSHLLRASETADWLEWSDWADPVLAQPCEVRNGFVTVPDRPGNSIEWNEAAVAKYAI
jgi:mandelate racemase